MERGLHILSLTVPQVVLVWAGQHWKHYTKITKASETLKFKAALAFSLLTLFLSFPILYCENVALGKIPQSPKTESKNDMTVLMLYLMWSISAELEYLFFNKYLQIYIWRLTKYTDFMILNRVIFCSFKL